MSNRTVLERRHLLAASAGLLALSGCTSNVDTADDSNGDGDSNKESGVDNGGNNDQASLDERFPDRYATHEPTKLVVLSDIKANADSISVTITGTVVNGSDTDYEYAQIEFGLYDDTGAKVGNALDNISGIDAGERWRFKAVGTGDEAARWELESMSAY